MFLLAAFLSLASASLESIYVVPHANVHHGWIDTIDTYYKDKVVHILDNVVTFLAGHRTRKFVWAETAYFSKWYAFANDGMRAKVKKIVDEGRFEFVGGGWVQHDETLTNIDDIFLQLELGHRFLDQNFGRTPRVAWQVNSFGHSAHTPSLFRSLGYDYLVINRIDDVFAARMEAEGALQFLWQGADLGPSSEIFTYALTHDYTTPSILQKNSTDY